MSGKHVPRFIAFYSHKGGVGRSIALANTAYLLARKGRKVLIIDMDLEAPGQHMSDLFRPNIVSPRDLLGWPGKGLLELFGDWQSRLDAATDLPPLEVRPYLVRPREEVAERLAKDKGELWLLPSGNVADPTYPARVRAFSWERFYELGGQALLDYLKHRFADEGFDDVLIDSRTGLSSEFYVSALELAEIVVVLTALNWQNIEGTRKAVDALRDSKVEHIYGRKRILLVASPMPEQIGWDTIARRLDSVRAQWEGFSDFNVILPYDPELALTERVFAWENDESSRFERQYLSRIQLLVTTLDQKIESILSTKPEKIGNPFARLRREYMEDEDVVRFFVDPGGKIFEDMGDFTPILVTGARGSGKTMLASRFSLDVVLAKQRLERSGRMDLDEIRKIGVGLYFRIDADFLDSFNCQNGELRPMFDKSFSLFFDIVVIRKALAALDALEGLGRWVDESRLIKALFAECAEPPPAEPNLAAFNDLLERRLTQIRLFINNPGRVQLPMFLSANSLMKRLMEELRRAKRFDGCYFAVMIDEYENYGDYQQRIINTRLKQSRREDGVTYRLFMRSGGLAIRETLAPNQSTEEIHDYRMHSLDEELSFEEFRHHALAVADRHLEHEPWFKANGYRHVEDLFETLAPEDEARLLVEEGRRGDELAAWVKKHHAAVAEMVWPWLATESNPLRRAVFVVLLNQGKKAETLLAEFGAGSQRARDWYHNYHVGALHWLCRLYHVEKRYAGISQVLGLSGNNVRVFLDFCHAIVAEWLATEEKVVPISWKLQDIAIHRQARILRENLYSAARSVNEVNNLLERLGRLFEVAHKSPRQSEPEINHFSIHSSLEDTASWKKLDMLLKHAWYEGVLRQKPGNKQKSLQELRGEDWLLSPWLAPLFGLSTRRKKKLTLKASEVVCLFQGSDTAWRELFNKKKAEFERHIGDDLNRVQGELL